MRNLALFFAILLSTSLFAQPSAPRSRIATQAERDLFKDDKLRRGVAPRERLTHHQRREQITADDAPLFDIEFVGAKTGWAVGAEGVIWKTLDGGVTWDRQICPVRCLLRDVDFLTDQIGFVVGEGTVPHVGHRFGVLLTTRDGGKTWTLSDQAFPPLRKVQFFGLEEGIVAGESSAEFGTGLLRTTDGGKTWKALPGRYSIGWKTAGFLSPQDGVVAGLNGRFQSVGGGRLMPQRNPSPTLRGFTACTLKSNAAGWLVGDGALLRKTNNRGASWNAPPTPFPQELAETCDFAAVDAIGEHVWIAGSPGSVVWHSADGGKNWEPQSTGETVPIRALHFRDELNGWATGELGLIMRTADGGKTWIAVKSPKRRAAILHIAASEQEIDFASIALNGGDLGYRAGVLLPIRREIEPEGNIEAERRSSIVEGVRYAGGAATIFDWQWPLMLPEIEGDERLLVEEWNRMSEDRLAPRMIGALVCHLRTWRPSVVIMTRPAADDAAGNLLLKAVQQAIRQAADPAAFPHHQGWANLPAHRVQKLYYRNHPGNTGRPEIDTDRYRLRLGNSIREQITDAIGFLQREPLAIPQRQGYELDKSFSITGGTTVTQDFFLGCPIRPDSPARRKFGEVDSAEADRKMERLKKQKHFRGHLAQAVQDDRKAAEIIAHLRELTRDLEDADAAKQLAEVASAFRSSGRFDLAEETWLELIERYPNQPVTVNAMRDLFWRWCSAEVTWQRQQARSGTRTTWDSHTGAEEISGRILRAAARARVSPFDQESLESLGPDPASVIHADQKIELNYKDGPDQRTTESESVRQRQEAAIRLASAIRKVAPNLYRTPDIQFPLAALLRSRGQFRLADELQNKYRMAGTEHPWQLVAASESWLNLPENEPPLPIHACVGTRIRPNLDGVLSDPCWQEADEFLLKSGEGSQLELAPSRVQCLRDSKFLYLAISVPVSEPGRNVRAQNTGRSHDADLTGQDRVRICFDVDRDYLSYFQIEIDETGRVREACWGDESWNPKMYVAANRTAERWQLEIAIPFDQLVQTPPVGEVWGLGLDRIIPAKGMQSWGPSPTREVSPRRFGMLAFRR